MTNRWADEIGSAHNPPDGAPLADFALEHRLRRHHRIGLQHRGVGLGNLGFARRSKSRTALSAAASLSCLVFGPRRGAFLAASGPLFLSHCRFFAYAGCAGRRLAKKRSIPPRVRRGRTRSCGIGGTNENSGPGVLDPHSRSACWSVCRCCADWRTPRWRSSIDHLAMSGIIAYGVVYCFFM
mgnify:CR=1 FL=1